MNFEQDLSDGKEFEDEFTQYLWDNAYTKIERPQGEFSSYDINAYSLETDEWHSFELKCDRMAKDTGNIAVEVGKVVSGNIKPSGLSISESDYIIYKANGSVYKISTPLLRFMSYFGKIVSGGDNNRYYMSLLPLKKFISQATLLY